MNNPTDRHIKDLYFIYKEWQKCHKKDQKTLDDIEKGIIQPKDFKKRQDIKAADAINAIKTMALLEKMESKNDDTDKDITLNVTF